MTAQLSPRYVVYTLFNRWKLLVLFFTICVLMACLYIYFVPLRYESHAQIVVKVGEQDIADDNITLPPGQTRQQASGDIVRRIVNTRLDILQSNDVTRATLQKLGVEKVYPEIVASSAMFSISSFFGTLPLATPFDAANKRLVNDLTATVAPNSNTLKVSLVNRNPSVAQETLRTLIALFMEKDLEVMRNTRVNFLDEQVTGARAKVDTAQSALLEYKKEKGLVSLYDEQLLLLKQRDLLEQNLSAQNTQSLQLSVAAAHNLLAAAEQRYLQAKNTYSPANPLLQDSSDALELVRRQYNALMSLLANNLRSRPRQLDSPPRDNSASPFVANNALVNLWMSQLKSVNDRLDQFNLAEGKLLDLQRQLDVATQGYTTFMQRTADARATEALNQQGTPSIAISQEPTLPYEPTRLRILHVLGLAVVLGLIGGSGLCFFLEAVGKTIGLPEQVEPLLGLPVIATLNYSHVIKKLARGS